MGYTVRFDRGNRWWTCSVFQLGADGQISGSAVASGTGPTRDDARDAALMATEDSGIRSALSSSDNRRPYWVQGALGEQQEAQRKATADEASASKKRRRS